MLSQPGFCALHPAGCGALTLQRGHTHQVLTGPRLHLGRATPAYAFWSRALAHMQFLSKPGEGCTLVLLSFEAAFLVVCVFGVGFKQKLPPPASSRC